MFLCYTMIDIVISIIITILILFYRVDDNAKSC